MKRLLTIATILTLLWSCAPKLKEVITIPPQMEQTVASVHIVNKDDSLYKIAMKYGITRKALLNMSYKYAGHLRDGDQYSHPKSPAVSFQNRRSTLPSIRAVRFWGYSARSCLA